MDNLAHDVRTPLAALLMWTRLLKSGEAQRPAALDAIERSATALAAKLDALEPLAQRMRETAPRKRATVPASPGCAQAVRDLITAFGASDSEGGEIVIRLEPGKALAYVEVRPAGGSGDTSVTTVSLSASPRRKTRRRGTDGK